MRPAELWPYDYGREAYTANLWVSEGFTNYYASLSLLRAGLETREQFLAHVANAISSMETADARQYVSIADASTSTWLSYGSSQAFGVSYYAGGEVIAAMLDLAILHASGGSARLDDLMRGLWRESAVKGRGFSRTDFETALTKAAERDVTSLLRRMVDKPGAPPYDSVLAFAGYRLERIDRQLPVLGMVRRTAPLGDEILRITPGGSADRAGLQVGDVVQTVADQPVASVRFVDLIGRNVRFNVLRRGERETVWVQVVGRAAPSFRIVETETVTPTQRALRERWLGL
jgi:predicted metalloprotease with PDZ domain